MQNHVLEAFDAKLASSHMRGQWKSEEFLTRAIGGPKPAGAPTLWKWRDVTALLEEAATAMPESLRSRRSLIFQNPELPRGTTHTINMGIQMIQPGETAWAHRHSIAALRFVAGGLVKLMERFPFLSKIAYILVGLVGCQLLVEQITGTQSNEILKFFSIVAVIAAGIAYDQMPILQKWLSPSLQKVQQSFAMISRVLNCR